MCVNFIPLNKVTITDHYPLPRISDILSSFGGASWFSNIDLFSGFHQVLVNPDDQAKTAFVTKWGQFEYIRMPFGLKGAPRTFQRMMNQVFAGYIGDFVTVYLDDITIYSTSFEEHLTHLEKCLDRIKEANLGINAEKSILAVRTLHLLGHVIDAKGKRPDPEKIEAIMGWPQPKNGDQVLSFLGLVGYYQQFIDSFSGIAAPLFQLTHNGAVFRWSSVEQEAFAKLKKAVTSDSVLIYPDFTKPFHIFTDACKDAIGAVLCQEVDAVLKPIEFMSKKFSTAEYNYAIYDKEMLAVIRALAKFRYYILGYQLTVHTDNMAVKFIMNNLNPTGRRMRWLLELMDYDFEIVHIPGKANLIADGLSRQFSLLAEAIEGWESEIQRLIPTLTDGTLPMGINNLTTFLKSCNRFVMISNALFKKGDSKLVRVPKVVDRHQILLEAHEGAGHFGQEATIRRAREAYWWPGMESDIINHVRRCELCQRFSKQLVHDKPVVPIVVSNPFELWGIDFLGPLPKSTGGSTYIIVATEYFTRWPVAAGFPDNSAQSAAAFLYKEIFTQYGPPKTLLSDQGSHFRNLMVRLLTEKANVTHRFATAYNPKCNGLTERFNKTLTETLEKMTQFHAKLWEDKLPAALWNYRTKVNKTTNTRPYDLLYGVAPRIPGMIHKPERTDIETNRANLRDLARERYQYRDNTHGNQLPAAHNLPIFREGQRVLKFKSALATTHSRKFLTKWTGPYTIYKQGPHYSYFLEDRDGNRDALPTNGRRLKLYHQD